MRNKIGFTLFSIGFFGILIFGMGLDSPGEAWKGCLIAIGFSFLIGMVGYLLMDVDEVLYGAGLQKKESRQIRERKARNREIVFQNWLTYRI